MYVVIYGDYPVQLGKINIFLLCCVFLHENGENRHEITINKHSWALRKVVLQEASTRWTLHCPVLFADRRIAHGTHSE